MTSPEEPFRDLDEPQARVVVVGAPVDNAGTLFAGSLDEAREFVLALPEEERGTLAIVTDGRVYGPHEI